MASHLVAENLAGRELTTGAGSASGPRGLLIATIPRHWACPPDCFLTRPCHLRTTEAIAIAERQFAEARLADALVTLDQLGAAGERDASVQANRCLLLQRLGRVSESIGAGLQAVALNPAMAVAFSHLGAAYRMAGQLDDALAMLDRSIALAPGLAEAHVNRGLVLQQAGLPGQAIEAYRSALALQRDFPEAWTNLGLCLRGIADVASALDAFRQALASSPAFSPAWSNLLMCAQYDPSLTAAQLRALALGWREAVGSRQPPAVEAPSPAPLGNRALRIGYVSADFYEHPVGRFLTEVLRCHDRGSVEATCYASQVRRDALTEEMMSLSSRWRWVAHLSDQELAAAIRADAIDVLIDLSGHTAGNRLGVFAQRAAPAQASWLGYFASTGLAEMDAVILSRDQLADGAAEYFTEEVVTLDCCQFVYSPPADAPEVRESNRGAPVFGSFNNISKLNNWVVGTWSAILREAPGSRLVLKWDGLLDPWVRERFFRRFEAEGVDRSRLDLRGPVPHRDMLEEYGDIDIALDPFPFGGGLTTAEALWMGVPVVTFPWKRPVSRQSASMLGAIGLGDLVASSAGDYIGVAKRLANDPERRAHLRATLRSRVQASEVGNGRVLARNLEEACRALFERARGGAEARRPG